MMDAMMTAHDVTRIIGANPELIEAYVNRVHFKSTVDTIRSADQANVLTEAMIIEILLQGLAGASKDYQAALDHAIEAEKLSSPRRLYLQDSESVEP